MLREASGARRWVTLATGVTGVVAAHLLAYVLAFSDANERAQVLHDTGHGYFSVAVWLAAGTAALSVAAVAAKGAARTAASGRGLSVVPRFGPLIIWQGYLFLGVEASERLAAGAPLAEMLHGHEVLIGLVVQVAVAAAIVLLLGGTERLSTVIANVLKRPVVRGGRQERWRPSETQPRWPIVAGAARPRAPPGLATLHLSQSGR